MIWRALGSIREDAGIGMSAITRSIYPSSSFKRYLGFLARWIDKPRVLEKID
jgi:hypothetical protein